MKLKAYFYIVICVIFSSSLGVYSQIVDYLGITSLAPRHLYVMLYDSPNGNIIDSIMNDTIYDVDGLPVLSDIRVDSANNEVTAHYYLVMLKDTINHLVGGVEYIGGYEQLLSYCDSFYYNRNDYNYEELNADAYYTILFDKKMQIKEIRIIRRFLYDNETYSYDDLIKRILFSTEGKWTKKGQKGYDWYFYLGRFHLK